LSAALSGGHLGLFAVGGITAALTAFYMSRLFLLTFIGDARDSRRFAAAHEGGVFMTGPLVLLAVLAVLSGFFLSYVWPIDTWIPAAAEGGRGNERLVLAVSLGALLVGSGLAWAMYRRGAIDPARLASRFPRIYAFLGRRIADEIYRDLIERVILTPSRALARFDLNVLDRKWVDGVGRLARGIARAKRWVDDVVVDGLFVNGFGRFSQDLGEGFRRLQTGSVQFYLLVVAAGLSLLLVWAIRTL
jgi:NADH-quinone oxidoreductase subunit L